jgi:hypothetical protein
MVQHDAVAGGQFSHRGIAHPTDHKSAVAVDVHGGAVVA